MSKSITAAVIASNSASLTIDQIRGEEELLHSKYISNYFLHFHGFNGFTLL
jgi:hypothetical protein